ncbi:hypothetical protein PQX77_010036 [Marasmius sp. AFHP31]|nr:hypothetical protein PQX77_010036 [Marasmius sp. AFHP31]
MSTTESSPIPSVPSLASITTAATSPSDQQHTPPNIDEGELIEGKLGWKRVFALGGLSRSSSLNSKHRKSASVGGSTGSGFIKKLSLKRAPTATSATTAATAAAPNTTTSTSTEVPKTHSTTQEALHIHSPSPQKRDFGLHIDLPQRTPSRSPYMSAPSTRPPSRSEHLLREALLKDGQTTATNNNDVRRRTSMSSRAASRATSPAREWGTGTESTPIPMSPHEQVLRARLEHVLGQPMQEGRRSNGIRRYSHSGETHPGVGIASGGIMGWLWPQSEREDLDSEHQEDLANSALLLREQPQSPLTYLPTPQTGSSGATAPPSASSTSGFFDSFSFGGFVTRPGSRRSSFNHSYSSPQLLPPPRERSRTEPVLELNDEDEAESDAHEIRANSRAMDTLVAQYRKHGRSSSMTSTGIGRNPDSSPVNSRAGGLTRSSSVSSSIGTGRSQQDLSPSPTNRRKTKAPMFTLGLETVRSVADMRALAAAGEGEGEGSLPSSSVPSNRAPIRDPAVGDADGDVMLTPPPTPPGGARHEFSSPQTPASSDSSPVRRMTPLPSRIPVPVRKISISAAREKTAMDHPVSTTPTRKTAPSTPARERTPARSLTQTNLASTPTKSHPRIRTLSIQTSGERRVSDTSQSTPCTPQRTKTFPMTVNPSPVPRTPQPQRKAFLGVDHEARRPVHPPRQRPVEYAVAPDPTEFRIVDNPAALLDIGTPGGAGGLSCATPGSSQSRFNIRTASAQCRAQEGYVSFAMVEGLGEPETGADVGESGGGDGPQEVGSGDGERKKRWLLF